AHPIPRSDALTNWRSWRMYPRSLPHSPGVSVQHHSRDVPARHPPRRIPAMRELEQTGSGLYVPASQDVRLHYWRDGSPSVDHELGFIEPLDVILDAVDRDRGLPGRFGPW